MPGLRVLAGPSLDSLEPISSLVNSNKPFPIRSDYFEGELVANIKGFTDENGRVVESEYFAREDRQGITWSIQVQGRFLKSYSADDIMFGNTFDRPLQLPWGSNLAFKFMKLIDNTLEHDLTSSTKPWALSPLIATMPHFAHARIANKASPTSSPEIPDPATPMNAPSFPGRRSLVDDTSQLHLTITSPASSASSSSSSLLSTHSSFSRRSRSSISSNSSVASNTQISNNNNQSKSSLSSLARPSNRRKYTANKESSLQFSNASQRRSHFSSEANRRKITFQSNDIITTDFCYGFIEFSPGLCLRLPGGISFDLNRYWDGQPVRFVCCERKDPSEQGGDPWGRILWCVVVEPAT